MRPILIITITLLTTNIYAQRDSTKLELLKVDNNIQVAVDNIYESNENDTLPKVIYINNNSSERSPAYYINGKFVSRTIIQTLKPYLIEDINVDKSAVEIENVKYYGQIHIKIKGDYKAKLISLNDLKSKYVDLKNSPVLFIVDNEIIDADYDKYLVDEKYILQIIVEKIDNKKEKLKFSIVKLLTRTEENIKKSKEIRIRGTSDIIENK